MIYSKIKYGLSVYGLTSEANVSKVQILQNKLLKVLLNKTRRFSTNKLHNEVEILKVKDSIKLEISTFVYKYFNGHLPSPFNGYFCTFSEVHSINTRENTTRTITPNHHIEIGANTVKVQGSIIWNSLNSKHKSIKTQKNFRKTIKKSLTPYESI